MRICLVFLILCFSLLGCTKNEDSRVKQIQEEKEKQKQKQSQGREIGTTAPDSAPQRGFDALKDIKEIRSDEHARQEDEQQTIDQIDNNQ